MAAAVGGFVVSTAPTTGVVTQKKWYTTQTSTARIKKVCDGRGWWVCCLSTTTFRGCHTYKVLHDTNFNSTHKKKCVTAAVGGFVVSTAAPPTGVVTHKKCSTTQTSTARMKKSV